MTTLRGLTDVRVSHSIKEVSGELATKARQTRMSHLLRKSLKKAETIAYSTMKALSVSLSLLLAAAFIQMDMAVGIRCSSSCAACWKTGSFGIDIKLYCNQGDCGASPSGYDSMHCAKRAHFRYVDLS